MNLRNFVDVSSRRKALEEKLHINLANIGKFTLDEKQASTRNCENMIGAAQIPLGIAGPLHLTSNLQNGEYFLPLATTEGALVASVNRGCLAISEAGGVTVISEKVGITRAPVFVVENILEGQKLAIWVEANFDRIKQLAESTSNHLTLTKITPYSMGRNVWLRFHFDTRDAMGMNMATIAAAKAVEYIEENTSARCIAISGNMCVDKKPNYLNFIEGRGYKVWTEAVLSNGIVSSVLKTNIERIVEVAQGKLMYGSVMSGSIGANAHFANILAAIFIAAGQDLGHVGECSMGVSTFEEHENGLYVSVYLPDLIVGTVGGGTQLATQKEALSIMGLNGGNNGKNARKFAEIIGGAVLAGELSLMASLAEGSLARVHEKYGRGK